MQPIIRIIAVLITTGIAGFFLSTPLNTVLFKYHQDSKHLVEIYEKATSYDMLFLGASRTHRSIYPKIFDSLCRVNSYNGGVEGGGMNDFMLTLEGYLANHPAPKVLVLTIDLSSFFESNNIHYYPQYYPYLNNKAIHTTLSKYGYHVNLMKALPFLSITDFDDYSKENAIQMLRGKDTSDALPKGYFEYKGFVSNTDNRITKSEPIRYKIDMKIKDESIASLNEIISECRQHNIRLIFTYAPEYNFNLQKGRTNTDSVFSLITQTANKNHIPYLRDDSLGICQDPRLFANNGHLNRQGAIVYSTILAEEINKILGQKY